MAEVLDLSTLKNKKPAPAPTPDYDSLTDEEKEALQAMGAEHPPSPEDNQPPAVPVRTAFLVIVDEDGNVMVSPDINGKTVIFQTQYEAAPNDIIGAIAVVQKDLTALEAGSFAAMQMTQMAREAQERLQNAAIAQKLKLPR
jgi:hypothetical protein